MVDKQLIEKEWFVRGESDLKSAKLLLKNGNYTSTIAVLIQQAVEKYLKGYLIYHGWKLEKIHDIETLITKAAVFNKDLSGYLDFARVITAYYIEDRYPPGPPQNYTPEEISRALQKSEELIEKIKFL